MELDWEQERNTTHTTSTIFGAFLGAVLGANCFLAVEHFIGLPAVLCGSVIGFWSVKGGELLSGRKSKMGVLTALPFILIFGFLSNHFCLAMDTAPGDPSAIWKAFTGIEAIFASSGAIRYWVQLSGLIDAALVAWAILFFLARQDEIISNMAGQPCCAAPEPPPTDMEFFLPYEPWIRPVRVRVRVRQSVCLSLMFLCGWIGTLAGHEQVWIHAMGGAALSVLFAGSGRSRSGRIMDASSIVYVRSEGKLWSVYLNGIRDPELHIPLSKLTRMWDRLSSSRQKLFRATVAKAIKSREVGTSFLVKTSVERESSWGWTVHDFSTGSRWYIPKVYPNFTPSAEAKRAKGPVPFIWPEMIGLLVVTVIFTLVGAGVGYEKQTAQDAVILSPPPVESAQLLPVPSIPPSTLDPEPITTARVPKEIGYYYLNGLNLQTDNEFEPSTSDFLDKKNGLEYSIALQYGVGEEAIHAALENGQAEEVRYLRPDSSELLWRMGDNSVVYQYNICTAYLPGGQIQHTGAALSERGTLLVIEAAHGYEVKEEAVRGDLLYMLENLRFTGPAITGDSYQEQLRPAVNMGFNYCGQAFLRVPHDLFGYDAFIDTFLPCGGKLNYYDDGLSVMTSVHGLRVSAAVVANKGTAMDTLDEIYQDLKAAGRQYDEQNLFEEAYSEEANTACRVTVYYDGGRTRVTVMYTIGKWEGYYLFKEMTCLPEEIDSEYQSVFKEMEASSGISVPQMETLGRFSD